MTDLIKVLEIAQSRGFLGPGSVVSEAEHAEAFRRLVPVFPGRCLDLGSGAGIPGLVLAAGDGNQWTLLDAMKKRCQFLEEAVEDLGLSSRVDVLCGRAEALAREVDLRESFGLVVARSFGAPAVVAECAVGFIAVGGVLIVSDPPEPDQERWPPGPLSLLSLQVEESQAEPNMTRLRKSTALSEDFPRRDGVPGKSPLW